MTFFYSKRYLYKSSCFYQLTKQVMSVELLKKQLHSRIDQADERFVRILHAMAEAYAFEHFEEMDIEAYEASLKPMTVEELVARAKASNDDIAAGRVYDLEAVINEELGA
jgi:DNA-binding LytR/AlgR family response regulator